MKEAGRNTRYLENGVDIHGTNLYKAKSIEESGLRSPCSVHVNLDHINDPFVFLSQLKESRIFSTAIGLAKFSAIKNSPYLEVDLTDPKTTPAIVVFIPLHNNDLAGTKYFSKREETRFVPKEQIVGTFPIPGFDIPEKGNYPVFRAVLQLLHAKPK